MRTATLTFLVFISLASGCVPPRSLSPTLEAQRAAVDAIHASYDTDLALLRAQLDAALAVRRTFLLGRIDRELVDAGYLDAAELGDALRADLADPAISNAVVDDLRAGRLSVAEAERLIADYRAAETLSDAVCERIRGELLNRLGVVREFDASVAAVRGAMVDHTADIAWLFQEAGQSSEVLRAYAGQSPRLPNALASNAPELWSRAVLSRISDPERRAAAEKLLADLLSLSTMASN